MWLITPRGFYSAVAKPDDGDEYITVRARSERDVRNLADLIDAEPHRTERADYGWRLRCQKSECADAVRQMALEINDDNFKNRIHDDDPERALVLSRVSTGQSFQRSSATRHNKRQAARGLAPPRWPI